MSDRANQQNMQASANHVYAANQQWHPSANPQFAYSSAQQYPTPTYSAHAALRNSSHQAVMAQGNLSAYPSPDRSHPYTHDRSSSMAMPPQPVYPVLDSQGLPLQQSSANVHAHPASQAYSHSRTHSSHHYPTSQSPNMSHAQDALSHYAAQMAYAEQMDPGSSQYPASPQRPFSCDMCALSFNRQHDLKRHRDTHTGEKPFLCNGGCGKTFTRKDALKRHQVRQISSGQVLAAAHRSSSS